MGTDGTSNEKPATSNQESAIRNNWAEPDDPNSSSPNPNKQKTGDGQADS